MPACDVSLLVGLQQMNQNADGDWALAQVRLPLNARAGSPSRRGLDDEARQRAPRGDRLRADSSFVVLGSFMCSMRCRSKPWENGAVEQCNRHPNHCCSILGREYLALFCLETVLRLEKPHEERTDDVWACRMIGWFVLSGRRKGVCPLLVWSVEPWIEHLICGGPDGPLACCPPYRPARGGARSSPLG